MYQVVVDGVVIKTTRSLASAESSALMWREAKHLAWVEWVNPVTGKTMGIDSREDHNNEGVQQ